MGIFGDDEGSSDRVGRVDEVKISAPDSEKPSDLKKEVESKFSTQGSSREADSSVTVDDLYEQNERIISLLESIANENNTESNGGSLNGVL